MAERFYPLKLYLRYIPVKIFFLIGILLNFLSWGWLFLNIRSATDQIFLHYTILFGVDLTGPWYHLYSVPLLGLIIIIVNALLGWFFFQKDTFVAIISNAISVVCQFFLFIVIFLLVFLNV